MKCPLFCIGDSTQSNIKESPEFDCLKKECSWWDKKEKACAIFALKCWVAGIAMSLTDMQSKMPHEEQFRK